LVALALGGCGGSGHPAAARAARVPVTERNFAIDLPSQIRAGRTTFVITGAGPSMHEFNVARTDLDPAKLPLAET
jgi:hypothetical protein